MISPVQPTKPYNPVKKAAKVAAGVVVTTGLVAAGLALGAKNGNVFKAGNNKYLNFAKGKMQAAGEFINKNLDKAVNKVKSYKINDRIVNSNAYKTIKSGLSSAGKKIQEFDLKGKFINAKNSVSNFIESHIHPEKLN